MLRKLGLGFMAFAITNTSFALELYHARIINHHESTTGGITAVYNHARHHSPTHLLAAEVEPLPVNLEVETQEQYVKLGEISHIQSQNDVFIMNYSDTVQEYTINATTCIQDESIATMTGRCAYSFDTISVDPHGYFYDNSAPELLAQFTEAKPQTLTSHIEIAHLVAPGDTDYLGSAFASSDIIPTLN